MQFTKNNNEESMEMTQAAVISSFGKLDTAEKGAKFSIKFKYLSRIRKTADTSAGLRQIFSAISVAMARVNPDDLLLADNNEYLGATIAAGGIAEALLPLLVDPEFAEDEAVFVIWREGGQLMTRISVVRGEKVVMGWVQMPAPVLEMEISTDPPTEE